MTDLADLFQRSATLTQLINRQSHVRRSLLNAEAHAQAEAAEAAKIELGNIALAIDSITAIR